MKYVDYGQYATDELLNSLEKQLQQVYLKASIEARKKCEKYWADFARKDKERKLLVDAGEWTKDEYIEWRANQIYIAGRWNELSKSLAQDFYNTDKIAAAMITDNNYSVFALNHNYGAYEIDRAVNQVNISWTIYNKDTVKRLAAQNPKLLPLKTTAKIDKDLRWNTKQLNSHLLQGILQGESIDKIAKRLPRDVLEMDMNGAIRRARTMATAAQNGGRLDSYREAEELGIELTKEWRATLDDRTRDTHAVLDGERVGLDDEFSNGLEYPGDPSGDPAEVYNCRCCMRAHVKGHERPHTDLSLRNIDKMSTDYETWYSNHAAGVKK